MKLLILSVLSAALLTACAGSGGPMERAGRSVDHGMERAGEGIERAGEKIQEKF